MHPYATSKDMVGLFVFMILFAWFVFFLPDYLGDRRQLHRGQSARHAAAHRARVVFLALLRDPARLHELVPRHPARSYAKFFGVIAMFSVSIIAFAPWLDTSRVRSTNYRPLQMVLLALPLHRAWRWAIWAPSQPEASTCFGRDLHRLLLPSLPRAADRRPDRDALTLPRSITEAVLGRDGAALPSGPRRPKRAEGRDR